MIFEKIFSTLPMEFYIPVLAVTLIYFIWMTVRLIVTRVKVRHARFDFYTLEASIRLHQGCHIENLPLISGIFETAPRRLSHAYEEMIQAGVDFYQKKWIPNPADFITADTVFDSKTAKRIKGYGFLYYSLLGILLAGAVMMTSSFLFRDPDQVASGILLGFLPLFFSVLFTLLFITEKLQNNNIAESSIRSLIQAISRKLPVFSDYNGLALLINQFMEYDRNMSRAVDKLTDQIDHFVMDGLTEAVTTSIERTLMESIAPSIERSTNAIITLSQDIVEKENNGMKDLAVKFSSALSDELSYQMEPLVKKICEVSNTLANSKNYLDIATQTLDTYRQNATELQNLTSRTLVEYEASKASFSQDVQTIAGSFNQFSQIAGDYNERIAAGQSQFTTAVKQLETNMQEGQKTLRLLLDGIFVEARNAETQAQDSQKKNESYLNLMQSQIDSFSNEFATRNKELMDNLSRIFSDYTEKQSVRMMDQQEQIGLRSVDMLESMEKAAQDIKQSSSQIKSAFEELEAARRQEEENAKNRKHGLFSRH